MNESQLVKLLKGFIALGICLLLLGHYLLSYANFPQVYGVKGMIISAGCIAFGLIFSLPTKMYLTFLWVKKENDLKAKIKAENRKGE